MATKKIKVYHTGLAAATAPDDTYSAIGTDGTDDKQIPLQSLATYVRGKLTDLDRIIDSVGPYTDRTPITLTPKQTDKAVSADGTLVSKSGWAIAEFTAELGNEYLFKVGETSADVCVFAEYVDKVETRAIDYAYTYGADGKVATATATYNGKTYVYTYTYAEDGTATITDSTGAEVSSIPSVYTTTVGSYQPMTRLNAGAELPKDGYCRFVSNFQAASSIKVVVSYKVGSADLTMRVLRDGMTASMCTQLSKINQKVNDVTAKIPSHWLEIMADCDTLIVIDGVERQLKKGIISRFDEPISVTWNDNCHHPKHIRRYVWHYNELGCRVRSIWPSGDFWKPVDAEQYGQHYLENISELDISGIDTSVLDMHRLFSGGKSLTRLIAPSIRPSGTEGPNCIDCSSLTALDVSGWDTSKVTSMGNMFWGCSSLTPLDVSGWDTSKVTSMRYMFKGCSSLTSLDVSGWDTSKVTGMGNMFWGCSSLTSLDVSGWDTSKVTSMGYMFWGCSSLTSLDVSGWDTSKVTDMSGMFWGCSSLTTLKLGEGFGKMADAVGTLDLSSLAKWTDDSVQTLLSLYDRAANGLGVITIKLHANTKAKLSTDDISALTAKGYTIA